MAVGDIGSSIQTYEFEDTYGRHPDLTQVKTGLHCVAYENGDHYVQTKSFLISDAGVITTPAEDDEVINAASSAFPHGAFFSLQNIAYAHQLSGGNVGIETVLVSDAGVITQHANHYCSSGITGATEFNLILQRAGVLALVTDHAAGEPYVITYGVNSDGSIDTPRKAIMSLEPVVSTYPQCIRVNDGVILGAYLRTATNVYARPLGVASDGTLSGLGQGTVLLANINAACREWINPQAGWYIVSLQGPGSAGTLAALHVAADGTFSIPANNTRQIHASAGQGIALTVLSENALCVYCFNAGGDHYLITIGFTPGDPFSWSQLDSKKIGTGVGYTAKSNLIAEGVLGMTYFTTGNHCTLWTYEVETEAVQLGHHELLLGLGP